MIPYFRIAPARPPPPTRNAKLGGRAGTANDGEVLSFAIGQAPRRPLCPKRRSACERPRPIHSAFELMAAAPASSATILRICGRQRTSPAQRRTCSRRRVRQTSMPSAGTGKTINARSLAGCRVKPGLSTIFVPQKSALIASECNFNFPRWLPRKNLACFVHVSPAAGGRSSGDPRETAARAD